MMRSLWTAASGMVGQQFNIDTISNNLSNVNTVGFKGSRADFEDLIYQTTRTAGTRATEKTVRPVGVQVGHGVKASASQKLFNQGKMQYTGRDEDIAIVGEGFFRVLTYDGTYAYTRAGNFNIDSNRQLVTPEGYKVMPEVILPEDFQPGSFSVAPDGRISVKLIGSDDPVQIGQMELYRFLNPAGLSSIGENLYKISPASGDEIAGRPARDGMGQVRQKFLEMSNVEVVQEMVNMIVAQRAYELNSKAVQTSDNMLGIAAGLKR